MKSRTTIIHVRPNQLCVTNNAGAGKSFRILCAGTDHIDDPWILKIIMHNYTWFQQSYLVIRIRLFRLV